MDEFPGGSDHCGFARRIARCDLLEPAAGAEGIAATSFHSAQATQRHLRQYLAILAETGDLEEDPALCTTVRRMLADLIALAFGPRTDAVEVLRDTRSARLRAIKDDITKHIDSCGLSVWGVAARQRVTPRYVQILFASEGTTFVQFVLALRLAEVRRTFADPRSADRSITEIAFDAGFGDISYFNRRFRRQFGVTPSQVRAEMRRNYDRREQCRLRVEGAQAEA
jgi:AraC-like DNA-binding protein